MLQTQGLEAIIVSGLWVMEYDSGKHETLDIYCTLRVLCFFMLVFFQFFFKKENRKMGNVFPIKFYD